MRKVGDVRPGSPDGQGDRGHYCVPVRGTAQVLTQSANSDNSNKPCFTLKMPDCCPHPLVLPRGHMLPRWWGVLQGGHGKASLHYWAPCPRCAETPNAMAMEAADGGAGGAVWDAPEHCGAFGHGATARALLGCAARFRPQRPMSPLQPSAQRLHGPFRRQSQTGSLPKLLQPIPGPRDVFERPYAVGPPLPPSFGPTEGQNEQWREANRRRQRQTIRYEGLVPTPSPLLPFQCLGLTAKIFCFGAFGAKRI